MKIFKLKNTELLFCFLLYSMYLNGQEHDVIHKYHYPIIQKSSSTDLYFGIGITDLFRNLEYFNNSISDKWLQNQNLLYDSIIFNISSYDSLNRGLYNNYLTKQKIFYSPRFVGKKLFFVFQDFNENGIQRMGYSDSLLGLRTELFNTYSLNLLDSCYYSFEFYEPSPNGQFIAFGISPNGSEKSTIFIIDVENKVLLPEKIEYSISGNIQWLRNNSGFFYLHDKELKTKEDSCSIRDDATTKFHLLNTCPLKDKKIVSRLLNPELEIEKKNTPRLFLYPNSDKAILALAKGNYTIYYTSINDIILCDTCNTVWTKLFDTKDRISSHVMYKDKFFGISYRDNSNGQIIALSLPDTTRYVIFNTTNEVIDNLVLTRDMLYISTFKNGISCLYMINPNSFEIKEVVLPFDGALDMHSYFSIPSNIQDNDALFFRLQNYINQSQGFLCDENGIVFETSFFTEYEFNDLKKDITVREIEIRSHDNINIPLSIVYLNDIELNGNNPLLIEAFGAYGHTFSPNFNIERFTWLSNGGIYAVAHVRGGGEKGEAWHQGGYKATKPNSWRDLISCAEYLINEGYTSPQNLAAMGSSAGGITIGRAITERPDLFKAAVIYVGMLNPLRHENTFNPIVEEYGTVRDSLEFGYLYEMDTYHHIKDGVNYPSLLITACTNDTRVPVWQPAKAVARFQEVSKDNIVLFRILDSGHYGYPPEAEVYSFLFWQLGHPDFKLDVKKKD